MDQTLKWGLCSTGGKIIPYIITILCLRPYIIREMINNYRLRKISQDPFVNYVVQSTLVASKVLSRIPYLFYPKLWNKRHETLNIEKLQVITRKGTNIGGHNPHITRIQRK